MTLLFAGLAVGAVYAIVAYGYNLTYTTSGVLNFATAHMTMVGTFIAASMLTGSGMPLWMIVGACLAVGAAVGFLVELTAVAPLRSFRLRRSGTGVGGHGELVTTVGVSTIITGLAFIVWASDPLPVSLFTNDTRIPFLGGQIRPSDLT